MSCTLEELMEVENEKHGQEKRSEWVVNAPEPPSLWRQLIENIKDTIFGRRSRNKLSSLKNQASPKRLFSLSHQLFPILASFRNYNAQKFKYDFMAGLTLATLSIPQSMGYATLAKLSPEYGLYTSIVPPLIYALLGTSRHIVIGPVAVDSLLLSSMIHQLKYPIQDYSAAYTALLLTVTFFTGIFQVAFGVFRLGFLVDYLSHATIVGFMAGAAVVIWLQQMKGLFGIKKFTNNTDIISIMKAVCTSLSDQSNWHPYSFILGFSFLAFIVITRYLGRRNKKLYWLSPIAPLLSVIMSSVIAFRINLHQHEVEEYRVEVLGEIKGGFNPSSVYQLQFDGKFVGDLIKTGLTVAVISLTEAIAVGRSFASLSGDSLDPNKEMVSLGLMNIVGSFTSCYVATASPSRTAVNYSAGSETVVSSIVMVITVLISLKFFTRFLYFTPKAVIASTIISTLPGLISFNKAYNIWKVDKIDFLACAGAFFGILLASVETGLIVAVMISFAKIIVISIQPGIEIVGRLPGTTGAFCDVEQYPMAVQIPRVLIVRVKSAWLCFANASFVRDRILRWVTDIEEAEDAKDQTTYKFLIIDMSSLMHIDIGGIASLEELHRNLTLHEVKLAIANPRWQVIHKLRVAKFVGKVGGRIFLSVGEAVNACVAAEISNV